MADIAKPDLFVSGSWTWISLDIARFYKEHCQPSSGSASLNGYTIDSSAVGDSTGCFGLLDIVPLLLKSNLVFA